MSWSELSRKAAQVGPNAQVAVITGEVAAEGAAINLEGTEDVALRKAALDADYDREKTIHDARVEVIKGALDRAQAGAEYVRNVATGILALYQAVLGLGFVANAHPVQLSAVVGTTFLALAIASAAAYVAWLGVGNDVPAPAPSASLKIFQERRLDAFAQWIESAVLDRVIWIHFAVICLFLGAIALPLPFFPTDKFNANDPIFVVFALVAGLVFAGVAAKVTLRGRRA